jgi:hypothetical protein
MGEEIQDQQRDDGSWETYECAREDAAKYPIYPDATRWKLKSAPVIVGTAVQTVSPPEPPDVPAIQEPKKECVAWWNIDTLMGNGLGCKEYAEVLHYTCADKSRILLPAEDGKYWCHKPQTEPR